MALLVAAQVFCRYVLNNSLFWSEELARYMLVWISFLGATTAYYRGLHPGVDIVVSRLSPGLQRFSRLLVHGISILFFLVIVVAGSRFAYFVRMQVSPSLGISKSVVLAVIPAAGVILTIYGLFFFLSTLKKAR